VSLLVKPLQSDLEYMARELRADMFGVADLTAAQDFICSRVENSLKSFQKPYQLASTYQTQLLMNYTDMKTKQLFTHTESSTTRPIRT